MLLTIATTCEPATDLGYLLAKHPQRCQRFDLNFGTAHVWYPQADAGRCEAALWADVDPVDLVRGKGDAEGALSQYVNDRPYTACRWPSHVSTPVPLGATARVAPNLPRNRCLWWRRCQCFARARRRLGATLFRAAGVPGGSRRVAAGRRLP